MPARDNPWAVYDVFTVKGCEQNFLAAVSDEQWQVFCQVLKLDDLKADPALATNNDRVRVRPALLATGGLAGVVVADGDKAGQTVKTTLCPITLQGQRLGVRLQPPKLGEHTRPLLLGLGYGDEEIDWLINQGVVA